MEWQQLERQQLERQSPPYHYYSRYYAYPFFYDGGYYAYGGYGSCNYLYRRAVATNSAYWWNRYYACAG